MADFMTTDEILDFAIQNEQNAVDLYTSLAEKTRSPCARNFYSLQARNADIA